MVFRMPAIAISLLALLIQAQAAKPPAFFKTPLTVQEMTNKQAVVNTSAGTFVIDLRPDVAPNHVGYFMKLAKEGAYNGTIFHRVIKYGIVQGGDPLSKDPAKAKLYGTGGLGVLKAELNAEKETRGAVSAVIQPGKPDSAGAQFFVCVTDQAALDGKYTVFGRVSEGMDVVQKISEAPLGPGRCDARRTHHDCDCRDPGHAPTGAGAVRGGHSRRPLEVPRGARHVRRPDHDRILRRQGARARPKLPPARGGGCLRRHRRSIAS